MASTKAQDLFTNEIIELSVDALLTATLRNNVQLLTELRHDVKTHPLFGSGSFDVRSLCPKTGGARLLRGVEQKVTYERLLALIAEMEDGIAGRVSAGQA